MLSTVHNRLKNPSTSFWFGPPLCADHPHPCRCKHLRCALRLPGSALHHALIWRVPGQLPHPVQRAANITRTIPIAAAHHIAIPNRHVRCAIQRQQSWKRATRTPYLSLVTSPPRAHGTTTPNIDAGVIPYLPLSWHQPPAPIIRHPQPPRRIDAIAQASL